MKRSDLFAVMSAIWLAPIPVNGEWTWNLIIGVLALAASVYHTVEGN